MSKIAVHVFADPGHAWAAVPVAELVKLGIAHEISLFSYRRRDMAYIEEDCDLPRYLRALEARGQLYEFKEHDDSVGIRDLLPYEISASEKYASESVFDPKGCALSNALGAYDHRNSRNYDDPRASHEQNLRDTLAEYGIVGQEAVDGAVAIYNAECKKLWKEV